MIISNDPNKFNAKKFNIVMLALKMHCFTYNPLHKRNFLLDDDGTKKKKTIFKQYFNSEIKCSFLYIFFPDHVRYLAGKRNVKKKSSLTRYKNLLRISVDFSLSRVGNKTRRRRSNRHERIFRQFNIAFELRSTL